MKPIEDGKKVLKKQSKIKKEHVFIIVLSVVAVAIFLSSTSLFSSIKTNKNETSGYENSVETRLENLLKEVDGVGKVKVFITTDGSYSEDVLKDVETKTENGSIVSEETVVLVGGKPYVTKTQNPKILGVAVVCQGGDNLSVKVLITEIITTTLSVNPECIRIIKMK